MLTRGGLLGVVALTVIVAGCGRVADPSEARESGGAGSAGSAGLIGAAGTTPESGGASASGASASGASQGGVTSGDGAAAGSLAGAQGGAAAGQAGATVLPEPVLDGYSRARWPVPNAPGSGLPHEANYDSSNPETVLERVTGLEWLRAGRPVSTDCSELSLAGHDDWRVPSRIELTSLLAYSESWRNGGGPFPILTPWLLSSSMFNDDPKHVWVVAPAFASIQYGAATEVHCVRTAIVVVAQTPSYVIDGPIVTDTATGLSWERDWGSDWASLPSGEAYCAKLELGGYSDWRVPSMQELASIIDDRTHNPAVDRNAFIGDADSLYAWTWTSTVLPTTAAGVYDIGRTMRFFDGSTITQSLTDPMRVRCTR